MFRTQYSVYFAVLCVLALCLLFAIGKSNTASADSSSAIQLLLQSLNASQLSGSSVPPSTSVGVSTTQETSARVSILMPQGSIVPAIPQASSATSTNSTADILASLLTQLAELRAEIAALIASSSSPVSTYAFTHDLQLHDVDDQVRLLQSFLNASKFSVSASGPGSPGYETTLFGQKTFLALVQFQAHVGLPATGFFGPLTRSWILNSGYASSANSSQSAPESSNATPTNNAIPTGGQIPLPSFNAYSPGYGGGGGGGGNATLDITPPVVSLTAPSSGAIVSGSSVTLSATASDNIALQSVQFDVDGAPVGSAITTAPYTITWDSTAISDGTHTISAVALNSSGKYATSTISVTVSNPFSVPDQTLEFGTLTRASQGTTTPDHAGTITSASITSGNSSGYWQVASDGTISPTSAGDTADLSGGPFTLGMQFSNGIQTKTATITITTRANTFTVSSVADLASVLSLNEATQLSGETIELRPGFYDTTSGINFFGHFTALTGTLTITSASTTNMAEVTKWGFAASSGTTGNVDFRYIHFYRPQSGFAGQGVTSSYMIDMANTVDTYNVGFYNDDFSSDFVAGRLGQTYLSRDVEALSCNRLCHNLVVEDSTFHDMVHALAPAGVNITIEGNEFYDLWADGMDISPAFDGDTDGVLIKDNVYHDNDGDGAQLHADFIQSFIRGGYPVHNIKNVTVVGNLVYSGFEGLRRVSVTQCKMVSVSLPLRGDSHGYRLFT